MTAPRRAIEAVFRMESARLIAGLTRLTRDVGFAEELAQEALVSAGEVAALGRPRQPRRLADDHRPAPRHRQLRRTLRLLGGLTTVEITRAFLVPKPTIAQRIVRAKRTLAEAQVPFEVPRGAELPVRLAPVCQVIDLVRLGRILAELVPGAPELHGLVALMEIQASRSPARLGPGGEPILLLEQNRARWDRLLIRRGLSCPGPHRRRDRLAAHRRALRSAPGAGLLAGGGGAEPRDLLQKLGRLAEARAEFERAAAMTLNARERELLLNRAAACSTC